MDRVLMTGHAELNEDRFDFKIGPWSGQIGLVVRRSSQFGSTETGAGLWESLEKAKSIASNMVHLAIGADSEIKWEQFQAKTEVSRN